MADFELPDNLVNPKKKPPAKRKKRKDTRKLTWETTNMLRCKTCRTIQLKSKIAYYWCSTEQTKKYKASNRVLWSSTCRFCGNKMNGK